MKEFEIGDAVEWLVDPSYKGTVIDIQEIDYTYYFPADEVKYMIEWDRHNGGGWYFANELKKGLNYIIICECGAEKTKTLHSHWCPKYKE